MNSSTAWFVSSLVCLVFTVFNILTVIVILCSKNQRNRVTTCPILYFLAASALQGFAAFPLYVFKKIAYKEDVPIWLCDASRFTYMHSGHVLKISLLLVSCDRLFAVKYPFKYREFVSRNKMIIIILISWFITVSIDSVPFFNKNEKFESCHYFPSHVWGFFVIICYDIFPFFIMVVSYITIWKIAARLSLADNSVIVDMNRNKDKSTLITTNTRSKSKVDILLQMKATKTSLTLIVVHIICWAPLGVFYTYDHFCKNCWSRANDLEEVRAAIKILSSTSSFFAPVIYCWFNHDFFKAAQTLLQKCGCIFLSYKNSDHKQKETLTLVHTASLNSN
ncbi:octopamine receptor beta-2R [Hydra vulgaris]|uniref:Octopamine receptor beta-2R n=1 Tax=Hydra vulgaris TaxID=6087 RepID=A0ABM4B5B4_HYDVU